jgi:Tfp pilus assembly pilus retraction ATPase PilT
MEKEIQDAFRALKKRDVDTFIGKVILVDKAKGTCNIHADELDFFDVQLSAVVDDNQNNFYLFPKVGSWVLVSPINEDIHRLYVEAYSEIESLSLVIDAVTFKVDSTGFLLKKQNETLKALMADLIGAIKAMSFSVTTPSGPGATTTLNNIIQFTNIETRFNQFLKDS